MKNIFVTGCAGFIGFHLCKKLLDKNYFVIGVDNLNNYYDVKLKKSRLKILKLNKNFKFYKGDIKNFKTLVKIFKEKDKMDEGWINGGFFVLSPKVLDLIEGDNTTWEKDPLEILAKERQLKAYRHNGFWQCMDTLRDKNFLEELWISGKAPWCKWK